MTDTAEAKHLRIHSLCLWRHLTTDKHKTFRWIHLMYKYHFIHSFVFSLEGRDWQEPEPSHVTGMALAHRILGMFLGVVCHCFPRL